MRVPPLLMLLLLAGPATALGSGGLAACKEDNTACREDCTVEYGSNSRAYSKLNACVGKCTSKYNLCRERHLALQEQKDLGIETNPASAAPPPPPEPTRYSSNDDEDLSLEERAPAAAASDTGRRGVYRASEPAAESKPAAPVARTDSEEEDAAPVPTPASPPKSEPAEPTVRRDVYRAAEPEPVKAPEPAKPAPVAASEPKPEAPAKTEPAPKPTVAASTESDPLLDEDPPPPPPKPKVKAPERPTLPPEPKHDISDWDPNGD